MIIFPRVFKLQGGQKSAKKKKKKKEREITENILKRELSFLYVTHPLDLFFIAMKYHRSIKTGIQIKEWTRKCLWTDGRNQAHCYIPRIFRSRDRNLEKRVYISDPLSYKP